MIHLVASTAKINMEKNILQPWIDVKGILKSWSHLSKNGCSLKALLL